MQKVKNIGPVSWTALKRVGIPDESALRAVGAVRAYIMVRDSKNGDSVSLNFLYAMVAGLRDVHWHDVGIEEKGRLLREIEDLSELIPSDRPRNP